MTRNALRRALGRWLGSAVAACVILLLWYLIARLAVANSRILPTPIEVARPIWQDPSFFRPHLEQTAREAGAGYLIGNAVAVTLAMLFVLVPIVEGVLLRVMLTIYSIPIIAIGPVLQVVLVGDQPKVTVAALLVFFPTLVATLVGLRSADTLSIDLVRASGGGSLAVLHKVRLQYALPGLFAGLRVAAPTAVLGAIIGEYFGANQGLGIAMVNAQAQLDAPLAWAIAIVATALAASTYAITALAERLVVPWAREARL